MVVMRKIKSNVASSLRSTFLEQSALRHKRAAYPRRRPYLDDASTPAACMLCECRIWTLAGARRARHSSLWRSSMRFGVAAIRNNTKRSYCEPICDTNSREIKFKQLLHSKPRNDLLSLTFLFKKRREKILRQNGRLVRICCTLLPIFNQSLHSNHLWLNLFTNNLLFNRIFLLLCTQALQERRSASQLAPTLLSPL